MTCDTDLCRDHPRVGGGTQSIPDPLAMRRGPSPRGRGNLVLSASDIDGAGTIPAWAGEPPACRKQVREHADHPRVGGGTKLIRARVGLRRGPSPRGRGNRLCRCGSALPKGTIPAWAGEPSAPGRRPGRWWDHPRVGGGTWCVTGTMKGCGGPSPRGRGNPAGCAFTWTRHRTIPAWAGEPQFLEGERVELPDHPRVGGGTRMIAQRIAGRYGPSPRGRGNQADRVRQ